MLVVHATVRIASLEVLSWKDIRKPKYLHIHPPISLNALDPLRFDLLALEFLFLCHSF
jgi:hypothetical protein